MKKYIYLDWNVYKYIKTPRLEEKDKAGHDIAMKALVEKLSEKYCFPYSEGHIKDAANKYNRQMVISDFESAEKVNHQECIGFRYLGTQLVFDTQKKPMIEFFDEYIKNETIPSTAVKNHENITAFSVDMSKISIDHPLYDFLQSNNGIMDSKKLDSYLDSMFDELFTGTALYKKLRAYVEKLNTQDMLNQTMSFDARLMLDRYLYFMIPFLDASSDNEEELMKKWPDIVYRYLKMSKPNPPIDMQLIQGYTLLDMHPLFRETLKNKKNTLDNIVRDGTHCFYASKAQYFVSEDVMTRKKINFIYKAYGIKTKVVSEAEFLSMVEVP